MMALDESVALDPLNAESRLIDVARKRHEMEENFHLYQEVQALAPAERAVLFDILLDAQRGNPDTLKALYSYVYEEMPVSMEEFLQSRRFLGLQGRINQEKIEALSLFARPETRRMYLAWGSGSGKSFVVSCAMAYMVYTLLCLRRPDLYFLLAPGSKIAVINLSVSKEQARDVIFAEFLGRLTNAPWFTRKYKATQTRARFIKRVSVFSGGSTAASYYGYHTIFGSLDEASFLFDSGGKSIAADLVEALTKSMSTRFPRAYKLFVISTLRSEEDYLNLEIERLRKTGLRVA